MLVDVVLFALAAFRIAELLVIDSGPFDIFLNIRGWFNGAPFDNSLRRNIASVLTCVHCTGLWIAIFFGIPYYIYTNTTSLNAIVFTLAVAGLQSIISGRLGRNL